MNNKRRVGVIGTGFIGAVHIENLRRLPNVEVVALMTTQDPEDIKKQYQVDAVYNDPYQMMDESELDVIHICSPNYTHADLAIYALNKGIHVFCEKPMAMTVKESEKMLAALNESNCHAGLNFHNRYFAAVSEMRYQDVGKPISIHGQYIQDWLLYQDDYSWRLISKESGNTRAIADIGSHWFDLAQFTTGLKITEVLAEFKTEYPIRKKRRGSTESFQKSDEHDEFDDIKIDTEDIAAVILKFENGAIGHVFISQMVAGQKNNYALTIAGTESSITWQSIDANNLFIGHRNEPNQILTKDPSLLSKETAHLSAYPGGHFEGFGDAFRHAFIDFYYHLDNPEYTPNYATFEDGVNITKITQAVYESAKSRTWVKIN